MVGADSNPETDVICGLTFLSSAKTNTPNSISIFDVLHNELRVTWVNKFPFCFTFYMLDAFALNA